MCATCTEPAAIAERPNPLNLTAEERRLWSESVAESRPAEDLPVCHSCGWIFRPADGGIFFPNLCGTCELNREEELILDLVKAKGKQEVKAVIKALKQLRKTVRRAGR